MGTTHFPNGVTTSGANQTLGNYGAPDPTAWHTFFNDFDTYAAGDWVITTTELGAGSATETLEDVDGGALLVTNDAADNDLDFFQSTVESFLFATNKKLIFKARFRVSDATQSDFVVGLQKTDTTMLDVTDGVFFQKDDGDTNLDFHVEKNNTATIATAIHTMVDATFVTVGFYYNGVDAIDYFINDVQTGTSIVTNLPDDEELTISFGIQNGEAVAKTMSVDYIFVAKER